jgi:hypothetical protein
MSRRLKIALSLLTGVVILGGVAGAFVIYAMQRVQPFYADAIGAEPQEVKSAGRRMEKRVSQLYEDAARQGPWQTVFTDDEVNGWLAGYLAAKHAELLPPEVIDPRLAFVEGGCKIGFRYFGKRLDAVISLEADAFMAANDVAAIRLRRAYLGALPLSMPDVVAEISKGAAALGLPIRWAEQEDDPLLLVAVSDALSTEEELRQLERLELRDGEVLLAGKTEPRSASTSQARRPVQATAGR